MAKFTHWRSRQKLHKNWKINSKSKNIEISHFLAFDNKKTPKKWSILPEKQNISQIRKLIRDKSPKSRFECLTAENGKTMVQPAEGAVIRHDQRPKK